MSATRKRSKFPSLPGLGRRSRRPDVRRPGSGAPPFTGAGLEPNGERVDLMRRREQLKARVAELQFDLGGLVYEMAIRNQIRVEVLVRRAAVLQDADAELGEVDCGEHPSCFKAAARATSAANEAWR